VSERAKKNRIPPTHHIFSEVGVTAKLFFENEASPLTPPKVNNLRNSYSKQSSLLDTIRLQSTKQVQMVKILNVVAITFLFILFSSSRIHSDQPLPYQRNSIDSASWEAAKPFLIPENHPMKAKLDAIFSKTRATTSIKTFKKAGFKYLTLRKWDNVIVAWHSKLKGHLVKVYLDDQIGIPDRETLMQRIYGADKIRAAINEFGYQKMFKVPKKWLYPLPDLPDPLPGLQRKKFIVVEEDMQIVSSYDNEHLWKKSVRKKTLAALFHLLETLGLKDSVYITNIPFSSDGRIAFVDTEHHSKWPVSHYKLLRFLSTRNQVYWNELIRPQ